MKYRADLHIHTFYSDGTQSPGDVVAAAKRAGVNLIAVTDHDNALCAEEVGKIAVQNGITAIKGVEFSAYEGDVKLHMLGYNLDFQSPAYARFYEQIKQGSLNRAEDILKKLNAHGVALTMDDVLSAQRSKGGPVHAMNIAAAGAKKGYAADAANFFFVYLAYGRLGYSCICRPEIEQTADVIKDCGGIISLAHPGRISLDEEGVISIIKRLKARGLDGIEAVYSGHTDRETQYYKGLAEKFGLLVTGGSDTHVQGGNRAVGTPAFYPDGELLSALKLI